jgi:hypothetical protein
MAKPNTRATLIKYAKQNLGEPVIDVNVADEQFDDRLDEALQFWTEFHDDAVTKKYYAYLVTETDVKLQYIVTSALGKNQMWINRMLPTGGIVSGGDFNPEYQFFLMNNIASTLYGGMVTYYMIQTHLSLIENMFGRQQQPMDFNKYGNKLHIFCQWGVDIKAGEMIVFEAYEAVGELETVFNDMWLKKYYTALIKKQWGQNLKKFDGMQLPGGVTMSGQQMYDEATAEIEKLEEEMHLTWEVPPGFFVG